MLIWTIQAAGGNDVQSPYWVQRRSAGEVQERYQPAPSTFVLATDSVLALQEEWEEGQDGGGREERGHPPSKEGGASVGVLCRTLWSGRASLVITRSERQREG